MNDLWERLDPGFLEPIWLLVGLVAVVAVALLQIGDERRRRQALRLFAAPHLVPTLTGSVSPVKRFWKKFLFLAGVAFLFVALARPHLFFEWQEEDRTGVDLLMAVDCSKSMLTQDVKPSRLERAKLAIADFADRLPDDRLGLIAFAGDAFLQVPLTLDHDAFQTAVRELDTDTIPRPGTDIATAINLAIQASKSQASNTKILILVTDGEDLEGRAIDSARQAAQAGLKIYTVGVGTPAGGLIPEQDESGTAMYLHDSSGQIVTSRLDEPTLKQIASITGGAYAPLGQRGEGLEEIYDRYIAPLPKQRLESRREKIRFERYEWPLGLSILLLVASSLMTERARPASGSDATTSVPATPPRRRNRNPLATAPLSLLVLLALLVPTRAATTDQAERDYKSGKYQDALNNYKEASDTQPNRDDLKYNLGDAAYKAGQYTQAEDAFRKSLETPDLGLQEKTYYNLGNAQFRHGEMMEKEDKKRTIDLWQQALTSYQDSMKLKLSADAQHNYEYVKKKLEDLKQQQQQQQQQQQKNSQSNQQDKNSQGGQGSQQNQSNSQDKSQPQNGNGAQNQTGQNQQQDQQQNQPQGGQPDQPQPDQNGNPSAGSQQNSNSNPPAQARSGSREEDQNDPGAKSQREAEALLDSLKDDEKHVTARTLNGDNEPPPPPPSGKDW